MNNNILTEFWTGSQPLFQSLLRPGPTLFTNHPTESSLTDFVMKRKSFIFIFFSCFIGNRDPTARWLPINVPERHYKYLKLPCSGNSSSLKTGRTTLRRLAPIQWMYNSHTMEDTMLWACAWKGESETKNAGIRNSKVYYLGSTATKCLSFFMIIIGRRH